MTTSIGTNRRHADEVYAFEAPESLPQGLQKILVDPIELQLQGKQAHWYVVGTNFRDLHLQLDSIVDVAREASDTIAERMRAIDAIPDGRTDKVVATTTVPPAPADEHSTTETVEMMSNRICAVVDTLRTVHDGVEAADPSTADLLHAINIDLEKEARLLKSETVVRHDSVDRGSRRRTPSCSVDGVCRSTTTSVEGGLWTAADAPEYSPR
jgi:starvation-inducible DNA-binding protein